MTAQVEHEWGGTLTEPAGKTVTFWTFKTKGALLDLIYISKEKMNDYGKFKWVPPACYCAGWLMLIAGPYLFPRLLSIYIYILIAIGVIRMIYLIICASIGLIKTIRLPIYRKDELKTDLVYTWVIPTVNEDEHILSATLKQLARHTRAADNYVVFLAFEDLNLSVRDKAEKLMEKFKT